MAIQKELWVPAIEENLYKGLELINMVATDDSAYVNGTKIHVPNAGTAPAVTRSNSTYPAIVTERTDADLEYSLTNFEIGPVRLGWADQLQLSYDKVKSITNDFMGNLSEAMKNYFLSQMYTYAATTLIDTTGTTTLTNWLGGTAAGSLKYLLGANVADAAGRLDRMKMPSTDRYLLLDYQQYWQLITDLSYNADRLDVIPGLSVNALVPKIFGFQVISLPFVAAVTVNTGTAAMIEPSATDGSFSFTTNNRPIALAFHKSAVSWAKTAVNATTSISAGMFGETMEATVYGGAKYRKTSANGVVAIRSTS